MRCRVASSAIRASSTGLVEVDITNLIRSYGGNIESPHTLVIEIYKEDISNLSLLEGSMSDLIRRHNISNRNDMPEADKIFVNDKDKVTIVTWKDSSYTLVRLSQNDRYIENLGFYIAYYQKKNMLSKRKYREMIINDSRKYGLIYTLTKVVMQFVIDIEQASYGIATTKNYRKYRGLAYSTVCNIAQAYGGA